MPGAPEDDKTESPEPRAGPLTFSVWSLPTWTAAIAVAFAVRPGSQNASVESIVGMSAFGVLILHVSSIIGRSGDKTTAATFRTLGMFVIALIVFWVVQLVVHIPGMDRSERFSP